VDDKKSLDLSRITTVATIKGNIQGKAIGAAESRRITVDNAKDGSVSPQFNAIRFESQTL
jgi:hypothetical protein